MASVPYSGTAKEPKYQISAHLVKIFILYAKNKMCFAIIGYNFNSETQFFVPCALLAASHDSKNYTALAINNIYQMQKTGRLYIEIESSYRGN